MSTFGPCLTLIYALALYFMAEDLYHVIRHHLAFRRLCRRLNWRPGC